MAQIDRYHPDLSLFRFLETYGSYLRELTYAGVWLTPVTTGVVLAGLLVAALALHSRALVFSWCLAIVTALPIAFIPPRTAFAFYIPFTGWTLYLAIVLVQLRTKLFGRPERAAYAFVTFFVVFGLLLRVHRIQRHRDGRRRGCWNRV